MLIDNVRDLQRVRARLKKAVRRGEAIGFDTEWDAPTIEYRGKRQPDPLRADIVGFSLAFRGSRTGCYIPLNHADQPPEVRDEVYQRMGRRLLRFVEVPGLRVWAHNWKSEIHVLRRAGYRVRCYLLDSELCCWLAGWRLPGKAGLKLKPLCEHYLGVRGPTFEDVAQGRRASEVPARTMAPYAAADALKTMVLGRLAWERMGELDLYQQYELDRRCIPMTAHMERTGVVLRRELLLQAAERCEAEMATVAARFRELTTTTLLLPTKVRRPKPCPQCAAEEARPSGMDVCTTTGCVGGILHFKNGKVREETVERLQPTLAGADVGNDRQVARWLFDELRWWPTHGDIIGASGDVIASNYQHPRNKVGWSVKEEDIRRFTMLPGVAGELARLRLRYQALRKYASTYTRGLVHLADQSGDGRLHCGFKQDGTKTQRYSSSGPNLQNLPSSERQDLPWLKDLPDIRAAFGTDPGWRVVIRDLSQIELRLLAHFSQDPNLLHVYRTGGDIHAMTMAALRVNRRNAKIGNFSVSYLITPPSLATKVRMGANDWGYTDAQAEAFIEGWYGQYNRVRPWQESAIERAEADGYARTITGFVELLPNWGRFKRFGSARKAVNTPIQGSAAGILKTAMVAMYERWEASGDLDVNVRFVAQVHDEIILEAREGFAAEADRVMALALSGVGRHFRLLVPLESAGGSGDTWSDAK